MAKKYEIRNAQDRAIEIYKWAIVRNDLPDLGIFGTDSIPGWTISSIDIQAMRMLTLRGLIAVENDKWPRTFKLGRTTSPETCLEPSAITDAEAGITRYKVPIGIARSMGGSSNLIKYKITPTKAKAKARK